MNKLSVAELHTLHPYDRDEKSWPSYQVPFDEALKMTDELHLQNDPLTYLEEIRENDYARAKAINAALLLLPQKVVLEELGEDIMLWSALSTTMMGENDDTLEVLRDTAGYNTDDLEIARGWVWRNGHKQSIKRELGLYGLMQALKTDALKAIDLPKILATNAKDGIKLDDRRINDYALEPIEAERYNSYYDGGRVGNWDKEPLNNNVLYPIWIDAPIGFALTYKAAPNAVSGLSMSSVEEVMINQIQGVKGERIDPTKSVYSDERIIGDVSSRGLAPLDWKKVMVDISEQIAINQGAHRIAIQSGANNAWTKIRYNEKEPHLPVEVAERTYDHTAKRLGYTKADNWHKTLTP